MYVIKRHNTIGNREEVDYCIVYEKGNLEQAIKKFVDIVIL